MAALTIRKRRRSGTGTGVSDPAYSIVRTYSLISTTRIARGLTFDGRYLWLCTEGVLGKHPQFVQFDPIAGTVEQEINVVDSGANHSLLDIAFDGRGFWTVGTTNLSGGTYYLRWFNRSGKGGKIYVSGLSSTTTSIAFDGEFIYISSAGGFKSVIDKYDRQGNQISSYSDFSPAASNGPGLVTLNRNQIVIHADPTLFAIHQFLERELPLASGNIDRTVSKESIVAGARAPLAFDGYFTYELDSS